MPTVELSHSEADVPITLDPCWEEGVCIFRFSKKCWCERSLPLELKYLPVIESGLNPEARSQRVPEAFGNSCTTQRRLKGLELTVTSTNVKTPYLLQRQLADTLLRLYEMLRRLVFCFGSLQCGPGNVNKAIRRSGGKSNYWEVRPFLPKETRDYVPNFIAVVYLMEHHADHGIFPHKTLPGAMSIDTIMVEGPIRFDQMAAHTRCQRRNRDFEPHVQIEHCAWPGRQISGEMAC